MKLVNVDRQIERLNVQPERQFTIKATGKAFKILSSGLYKDKILAVVRELSCNAYDAHVEAGCKDRPFRVHLPNSLEPYFSVQDSGPALSPSKIMSVFTTYFESTKNETNDQIGGLGLGCKSPLSYVDSFTVISRYEGTRYTYSVFYDQHETPAITLMSEVPMGSDEETGLEVSMPVRNGDYRDFRQKAERVYEYFTVKPIIVGSSEFKIEDKEVLIQGSDFTIYNPPIEYRKARALMGMVAYPVENDGLDLTTVARQMVGSSLDMVFNIGDLDITAGREDLSYDLATKGLLTERMNRIASELPGRVIKMFAACNTEFEARRLYAKIISGLSYVRAAFPNSKVPWRGKLIDSSSFFLNLKEDYKGLSILAFLDSGKKRSRYTTYFAQSDQHKLSFRASHRLKIFVDDVDGKFINSRVDQFRADQQIDYDIFVLRGDQADIAKLQKRLEGVEFGKMSDIQRAPPKPRAKASVLCLSHWVRTNGSRITNDSWHRTDVEVADGGIYVATKSGSIVHGENTVSFWPIYQLAAQLKLFDPKTQELYSIPKSLSKGIVGEPGWVDFFDHIAEAFRKRMAEEDWAGDIIASKLLSRVNAKHSTFVNDEMLGKLAMALPAEHPIAIFNANLTEKRSARKDRDSEMRMGDVLKIPVTAPEVDLDELCTQWETSGGQYPLLVYLFNYSRWSRDYAVMIPQVVEYINSIDNGRKLIGK